MSRTDLVVFTRDLRLRDHPALAAAVQGADQVLPLFVLDRDLLTTSHRAPNRLGFVLECLHDLDRSFRAAGGALVVRRGGWVTEVLATAAEVGVGTIHVSDDVSGYARRRLGRLEEGAAEAGIEVRRHPGITVVPPGALTPGPGGRAAKAGATGAHAEYAANAEYKVFTPYHHRWLATPWRPVVARPASVRLPPGFIEGRAGHGIPALDEITGGLVDGVAKRSPDVLRGGETEGLARLKEWTGRSLLHYDDRHDDLAADDTSRISAYLHAGCLSPLEVATRLRDREGAGPFVRQLCWRDFYHQVLAARPDAAHADYRPRGDRWHTDDEALAAWRDGLTGFPIVDAAMRQLAREGWMHNRARLIAASFLTKDLYVDWRAGAAHFMDLLIDGDVADNQLNWQWVAGTGNDTNRFRVFNPRRQAERFDPSGDYVRRYVPELADLDARSIHDPSPEERDRRGCPAPIVDHADAVAAYRSRAG